MHTHPGDLCLFSEAKQQEGDVGVEDSTVGLVPIGRKPLGYSSQNTFFQRGENVKYRK